MTILREKTWGTSNDVVTPPLFEPLARRIAATADAGEMTLFVTHFGPPLSDAGFGNRFRARCDETDVPGSALGLRKASATRTAEAGATTTELMAMFGRTTAEEAGRYTRAAERKRAAMQGAAKIVAASSIPAPPGKVRGEPEKGQRFPLLILLMVPGGGIEPPTLRFSVACSTN